MRPYLYRIFVILVLIYCALLPYTTAQILDR